MDRGWHSNAAGWVISMSCPRGASPASRRAGSRPDDPGVRGIAWSSDSRHILFGSMEGGLGWAIWQVDPDGSALRRVLASGLNMVSPAVSRDGSVLAAEQQDIETNLLEVPLRDPSSARLIAPSSRQDYAPVYAPDGKELAFISNAQRRHRAMVGPDRWRGSQTNYSLKWGRVPAHTLPGLPIPGS